MSAAGKILASLGWVSRPDSPLTTPDYRYVLHERLFEAFRRRAQPDPDEVKLIRIAPIFVLIAAMGMPSSAAQPDWLWPISSPHRVLVGYVAPLTEYSAGHRGIDIAADETDQVLAPADGVVSFAGTVVDRGVLSLAIDGDYVASLEPVTPLVAAGEHVIRGQVVAEVATGGHCGAHCLHFGVRLHGRYVSPLMMLGTVQRAVLLPLH